jgi:hypothetical protein
MPLAAPAENTTTLSTNKFTLVRLTHHKTAYSPGSSPPTLRARMFQQQRTTCTAQLRCRDDGTTHLVPHAYHNPPDIDIAYPRRELCKA